MEILHSLGQLRDPLGWTRGKLSHQMPPVTAELRVSQAGLCPRHWLLTILPTWEKPRERGGCCQTQLPRNVAETLSWKASRQESDPCTASVHTAFLKQLFTLRNYTLGLINRLLWAGVWVSHTIVNICQKRSMFLRVLAAWVISQEKCWALTAGRTAVLSRSSVPDCQVWNHWLHSWLCLGSQPQATSWLPDPLDRFLFFISLRHIKVWLNSVLAIQCWHYGKCLFPAALVRYARVLLKHQWRIHWRYCWLILKHQLHSAETWAANTCVCTPCSFFNS